MDVSMNCGRPLHFLPWLVPVVAAASCGGSDPPAPPPPPQRVITMERLYYDNSGGIKDSLQVVIRERDEFLRRWDQATSLQPTPPNPPPVDFSQWMVLLVGSGRMESGAEIRVDSAAVQTRSTVDMGEQEALIVFLRVTQGCAGFGISTYPLEIVRLPSFEHPVEFRTESVPPTACEGGSPTVPPGGSGRR